MNRLLRPGNEKEDQNEKTKFQLKGKVIFMREMNMNKRSTALAKLSKHIASLKILAIMLLIFQATAFAQQTVQYFYDDNGRLRTVTYPSGEAAVYNYDDAGNILAIRIEQGSAISIVFVSQERRCDRSCRSNYRNRLQQ